MTKAIADDNDWRRQPWVWFVIGVLVFTAIASFALLVVAASNPPDLVVTNYANIEEFTAQTRQQDRAARELGLSARVTLTELTGDERALRIELGSAQAVNWEDALLVRATNSTRADLDSSSRFAGSGGVYTGTLMLPGNAYYLHIEPPSGNWRLTQRVVGRPAELTLMPYSPAGVTQ